MFHTAEPPNGLPEWSSKYEVGRQAHAILFGQHAIKVPTQRRKPELSKTRSLAFVMWMSCGCGAQNEHRCFLRTVCKQRAEQYLGTSWPEQIWRSNFSPCTVGEMLWGSHFPTHQDCAPRTKLFGELGELVASRSSAKFLKAWSFYIAKLQHLKPREFVPRHFHKNIAPLHSHSSSFKFRYRLQASAKCSVGHQH